VRDAVKSQIKPSRHAAIDRHTAAQMASLISRRIKAGGWSHRRTIAVAGGILVLAIIALAAHGFREKPDIKYAGQFYRGRVAKLSPPDDQHEYASAAKLNHAVEPSVVQIETSRGIGSGFVLDKSGLIVTCWHCIQDEACATVVFADGKRLEVLGTAAIAPACDVAILVVEPSDSLVPLALAEAKPWKGERIVIIGSPGGLSFTRSEGSVSGLRIAGTLSEIDGKFHKSFSLAPSVSLVQITALMMPGNSGGPVVDFSGNVIAIASFGLTRDEETFNFCIDSSEIRRVFAARDGLLMPLATRGVPTFASEKESATTLNLKRRHPIASGDDMQLKSP
jgi:S1-C subfamily serine protease